MRDVTRMCSTARRQNTIRVVHKVTEREDATDVVCFRMYLLIPGMAVGVFIRAMKSEQI
jgi:hypothetical protein